MDNQCCISSGPATGDPEIAEFQRLFVEPGEEAVRLDGASGPTMETEEA